MSFRFNLLLMLMLVTTLALRAQDTVYEGLPFVAEGKLLPDSSYLITLHGDTVSFGQLKGKWLLINYWSTSCRPCIKEMPFVLQLEQSQGDVLTVVMINLDNNRKKWQRGIDKYDPPAPHYRAPWDRDNALTALNLVWLKQQDGSKKISTIMPRYMLIAPDGTIIDKDMPKPSDPQFFIQFSRHRKSFRDG